MSLAVGIVGAGGRMGRMIARVLTETPGVRLGAAIESAGSPNLGSDAGALAGLGPLGVAVESDLGRVLDEGRARVLIDFSAPEATHATAEAAMRGGVPLVVGTTGGGPELGKSLWRAAERVPIVCSANMSLGVNVLLGLLRQAAKALGPGFDVEIVELHHRMKKDAPSGTALMMARELADTLGRDLDKVARYGREGQTGARTAEELGVLAVRGGDVVGEHTAYFFGAGERLEITHRATSRETFARGAVRAAAWVAEAGRQPGLYDMQDVLGLRG